VNEAEIRRLWDRLSLADLLERHPRRPGAAAIRSVIGAGVRVTRSDLEARLLDVLQAVGLPLPATNLDLHVGGEWIEADCVWRDEWLIVELDGYETHRTRAAYERDRARDRALTASGWRVIRITWRQLEDEPERLIADLRAALALGPAARSLRQNAANA
jgi:very-short-patch-repair endonuclease